MSLTSLAIVGVFAIVVLLIARAKLRQKDAEMTAMATMMGLQKAPPDVSQTAVPGNIRSDGQSEVREWSFGDKPEDLEKPGVHFQTRVKIQVTRKKF